MIYLKRLVMPVGAWAVTIIVVFGLTLGAIRSAQAVSLGVGVRTRLVGAGVGIAIAVMIGFGATPALADHDNLHIIENLKGGLKALEERVWDCEHGTGGADGPCPGIEGPQGDKGDTGDTGATGATGPAGDDAFFDTSNCVTGDIVKFTENGLECVGPPPSARMIFVSVSRTTGRIEDPADPTIVGVQAADNICNQDAAELGVPSGPYIALLSTSGESARSRVSGVDVSWINISDETVAFSNAHFFGVLSSSDPFLLNPIRPTAPEPVATEDRPWTGSTMAGEPESFNCENWTNGDQVAGNFGWDGDPEFTTSINTGANHLHRDAPFCSRVKPLYCVQSFAGSGG